MTYILEKLAASSLTYGDQNSEGRRVSTPLRFGSAAVEA